jgi:tRNA pseudouridine38-40 synthase
VQGELEKALGRLSGDARVRVDGAGRTDSGVHARGQVIAFTYAGRLKRRELERALAALLPRDIGLSGLHKVDRGFKPRYRAKWREYRYFIWNGPASPLRERSALGVRDPLEVKAMSRAAKVFVGTHDFSAFGGVDRQPVRTIHSVRINREEQPEGQWIAIEVIGNAFLRQMVRRMVAALLRVGHGRATAADVAAALANTGTAAFDGETAPPNGLVLWRVPISKTKRNKNENDEQDIQPASE